MRIGKWIVLSIILFLCFAITAGCWNYREVDEFTVVAGVAIDKGNNGQYLITVETIHIKGGRDSEPTSQLYSSNGKTIFDAVRNIIALSGEKLYWSHTKVVIISKEVAKEGILPILDWFQRDSETRADINIIVSREKNAREILLTQGKTKEIISLKLEEVLKNHSALSKTPIVEIWRVINDIGAPGVTAVLPVVGLRNKSQIIIGTAIFKKDKLIGFLNGNQSQALLFVKDQIKGGILLIDEEEDSFNSDVTLEIFKNKTKIKPIINGNNIVINIKIDSTVAIDEFESGKAILKFTDESAIKKLEKSAEKGLNKRIESLIKHMQVEYGVDIFGFGAKIREEHPRKWEKLEPTWDNQFKDITVNVSSNINIKGSSMLAEPLEMGD